MIPLFPVSRRKLKGCSAKPEGSPYREVTKMDDPALNVSYETIARFFEAAEGNYRNAVYVTCSSSCQRAEGCRDFLFIPGGDCRPVIFPVSDAAAFIGTAIDPSDCAGTMTGSCFIRIYRRFLDLTLASDADCPIKQFLHISNMPKTAI